MGPRKKQQDPRMQSYRAFFEIVRKISKPRKITKDASSNKVTT